MCKSTQTVQGATQLSNTYPCSCFKLETSASAAAGNFAHLDGLQGCAFWIFYITFPLQEPLHLFLLPTLPYPHVVFFFFFKSGKFQGINRDWGFFLNPAESELYILLWTLLWYRKSTLPIGLWLVCVSELLVTQMLSQPYGFCVVLLKD